MINTIKIKNADKLWFTADTHFGHKNIVSKESCWSDKSGCRDFQTKEEMSQNIIENINKYVKEDDILVHLGDWSFGGIENIWKYRKQIVCKNIYLTVGNHDNNIKKNYVLPNTEIYNSILLSNTTNSEHPDSVKAQSLFTVVDDYLEMIINKELFCCMHFPIEEWNDRHGTSYMIHGHQHSKNTYKKYRLDIGLDNAYKLFGEYRPFSYRDIKQIFKTHG